MNAKTELKAKALNALNSISNKNPAYKDVVKLIAIEICGYVALWADDFAVINKGDYEIKITKNYKISVK